MSITVEWANPQKTLLCTTFQKPWTWQEWDQAALDIDAKLRTVNHPVFMVQDILDAGFPPNGGVWRFRQIVGSMQPNVEKVIFVGLSSFIQNLIEILHRLSFGHVKMEKFAFVDSMEAAQELVEENTPEAYLPPAAPV